MPGLFANASSQYLINSSSPVTGGGYPFTVGCWVRPGQMAADLNVWCIADTGASNHYFQLRLTAAGSWSFGARQGGTENFSSTAAAPAVGRWDFIVCRAFNATNRRISVLRGDSGIQHGVSVTSRAPTNLDTMYIGVRILALSLTDYWTGAIGEIWIASGDPQNDGTELNGATLKQLAFYGPLSVPQVRNRLIEYLPMKGSLLGNQGDYLAPRGRQNWLNVNGVVMT